MQRRNKRNTTPIRVNMGQLLSKPITTKQTSTSQSERFCIGTSCMQGWRLTMEDFHTEILALPDDPTAGFFAVYDGHGGAQVAQFAGHHLHDFILRRPEYTNDVGEAIKRGFMDLDHEILTNETINNDISSGTIIGSTAVVVLLKDNRLYCANIGDSRAIACIKGQVEVLSMDHKPDNALENKRIHLAGGFVQNNRVNGVLAMSRALGDALYKDNKSKTPEEQMVSAEPDIVVRVLDEDWEFVVVACDGIWEVRSNQDIVNLIHKRIAVGKPPEEICEEILNDCIAKENEINVDGLGFDNMTIVLICLLHGKPYGALVERCREERGETAEFASTSEAARTSEINEPAESGTSTEDNSK